MPSKLSGRVGFIGKGMFKERGCQENTETRQRDQSVQRPQGKSVPGVFEDLQGGQCDWSEVEGTLGKVFLMDLMWG